MHRFTLDILYSLLPCVLKGISKHAQAHINIESCTHVQLTSEKLAHILCVVMFMCQPCQYLGWILLLLKEWVCELHIALLLSRKMKASYNSAIGFQPPPLPSNCSNHLSRSLLIESRPTSMTVQCHVAANAVFIQLWFLLAIQNHSVIAVVCNRLDIMSIST